MLPHAETTQAILATTSHNPESMTSHTVHAAHAHTFTPTAATFTTTTFTSNRARGDGGGVYVDAYATADFTTPTFTSNIADANGGGIAVAEWAKANFDQGSMNANTANVDGGAIYTCGDITVQGTSLGVCIAGAVRTATTQDNGVCPIRTAVTLTTLYVSDNAEQQCYHRHRRRHVSFKHVIDKAHCDLT